MDASETFSMTSEDFNIPSPTRVELLKQIKHILENENVVPAFWAACQVADIEALRLLCTYAYTGLKPYAGNAIALIGEWNQSARTDQLSEVSSGMAGTKRKRDGSQLQRSEAAKAQCKMRDDTHCVLTGSARPQVAHIFPFCLMKSGGQREKRTTFWDNLAIFWDREHVERWKQSISTDLSKPELAIDSCDNLISLNAHAHILWNDGSFALKPVRLSDDKKELEIQFFWQPLYKHPDKVDLLQTPYSSEGLEDLGSDVFLCRKRDGSPYLRSGERITLRTDDSRERPLPNWDLLEMQWILQRLVGMSGAADWPDSEYDSESEVSSVEEEYSLDEDERPSFKRLCHEEPEFCDTSFRSLDGIYNWIPTPEQAMPKALPVEGPVCDVMPRNMASDLVLSERTPDKFPFALDTRLNARSPGKTTPAVKLSDQTGSDVRSLEKDSEQLHSSPITSEDSQGPQLEQSQKPHVS